MSITIVTTATATPPARPLSELAALVSGLAARPQDWVERVRLRVGERWYERLQRSESHEVWAISWLPGQATGFHDHGGSAGAFAVAFGTLEEHRPDSPPRTVSPGQVRAFGAHDVHDVRNTSPAPAVSIHAYSPPLSSMNRYELNGMDLGLFRATDIIGGFHAWRTAGLPTRPAPHHLTLAAAQGSGLNL